MRPSRALLVLTAFYPLAFADVKFTTPTSPTGGTKFTITWADSGTAPSLSDLTTYQLFLFTGSNASPVQLYALGTGSFSSGNTLSVTVPPTTGGSTANAYFLGMISVASAGGTVTNYSNRFTMAGMSGVFSAAVTSALSTVTTTDGPPTVNNVAAAVAAPDPNTQIEGGAYATPYTLQTGPMRYAPMQPVPGSTITATNTSPLYPTSSVIFASTYLPIATIQTTVTEAQTFSVASHENTAAAASQPTDDMQRFLNRWKD
ncbi:hypothetical protein B7494_g781 [Chlorociboria aeruginascens]|nr:hypothetical protein B7494_g781 [Chlorociboria aeruginascens]